MTPCFFKYAWSKLVYLATETGLHFFFGGRSVGGASALLFCESKNNENYNNANYSIYFKNINGNYKLQYQFKIIMIEIFNLPPDPLPCGISICVSSIFSLESIAKS